MNVQMYIMVLICMWWGRAAGGDWLEAPATYAVETAVLLEQAGFLLRGELQVARAWRGAGAGAGADGDQLLRFHLRGVRLHGRGAHARADWAPRRSAWDRWPAEPFYALLSGAGLVREALLHPADHPDLLNYKRALISLFQFQEAAGERDETDVSGDCRVLYETLSDRETRKIKRSCRWDGAPAPAAAERWEGLVEARRVARYTRARAGGALLSVYAEEVVELRAPGAGLKARSWHRLTRSGAAPAAPPAASLSDALPAALRRDALPLRPPRDDRDHDDQDQTELEAAVERALGVGEGGEGGDEAGGEGAGRGGGAAQAAGLLDALPALRAAPAPRLEALLHTYRDRPALLTGAVRLLGLAGSAAAHAAAGALLRLRTEPLHPLADAYLAALALAPQPAEEVVRDVTQLGAASGSPRVAGGALLAAAAAARRVPGPPGDRLSAALRDTLAAQLARCKDEACSALRLHALGNLRRNDTADLLLRHAERAPRAAALAALDALAAAPPAAVPRARLLRLALAGRPLAVRAAALDLAVALSAAQPGVPARLAAAAHELRRRAPHELRRVFLQRLDALAGARAGVRELLRALPAELRGWDARAAAGTSSVLARRAGWAAGGWSAALDSVQLAAGGLLQRGVVALRAEAPGGAAHDALSVELWTRGLGALAGAAPSAHECDECEGEGEAAGAGLAFTVGGVRMAPLTLFDGQAELMAHVWAGAGGSATPALRALWRPAAAERALALQAGVALRVRAAAALALALDAQAQVSLWSRTARCLLELRAGAALRATAAVRAAWAELRATAAAQSEPRLSIATDLDFYDDVQLCVRVRTHDHDYRYNATQRSALGARAWRVHRRRAAAAPRAGRTLSLGARNDAACRALLAAGDD